MPTQAEVIYDIHVTGHKSYGGREWREALLTYLNKHWGESSTRMLKIVLNDYIVRLGLDGRYYAYYTIIPMYQVLPSIMLDGTMVVENPSEYQFEGGVVRFVKNNQIRHLWLRFEKGVIVLSKGHQRGELVIASSGLPSLREAMDSHPNL